MSWQVRGVRALEDFAKNLLVPFKQSLAIEPKEKSVDELEAEAKKLRERLLEIELKIENQRKGKASVA
jgi:hypothetical protein